MYLRNEKPVGGWVSHVVRPSSPYAKVTGAIPCQGTCKNQPIVASMGRVAS